MLLFILSFPVEQVTIILSTLGESRDKHFQDFAKSHKGKDMLVFLRSLLCPYGL